MTPRGGVAALALALAAAAFTAQAMPAAQPGGIKGEVLETRDVEGYTYLRLKTGEGEIWAAVPSASVKKGAQVTLVNPAVMQNFESKTLKKTFDKIVFGQVVEPGAPLAAPHGTAPAAPAAAPTAGPMIKVAKATGVEAKTVAEVVAGKAALSGKTVLVRGQVVKVNSGILGKTWLHLQDGSGSAVNGTNDILVTTKDGAAVGDVVQAKGTVRTDVTVGPGYAYAVLIDDAVVRK